MTIQLPPLSIDTVLDMVHSGTTVVSRDKMIVYDMKNECYGFRSLESFLNKKTVILDDESCAFIDSVLESLKTDEGLSFHGPGFIIASAFLRPSELGEFLIRLNYYHLIVSKFRKMNFIPEVKYTGAAHLGSYIFIRSCFGSFPSAPSGEISDELMGLISAENIRKCHDALSEFVRKVREAAGLSDDTFLNVNFSSEYYSLNIDESPMPGTLFSEEQVSKYTAMLSDEATRERIFDFIKDNEIYVGTPRRLGFL